MKNIFKNRKIVVIIGAVILALAIGITCIILNSNKKEETKIHKEETHSMFVKINPFVKLVFKEEYYLCKDENGKDIICGDSTNKVIEYELINDDAKNFYKDLDFKNKDLYEVLLMLCDSARENKVGFESLEITTDSDNITVENILNYLKGNSKYEVSYSVYVNFEEHINEEDILKDEDTENKIYLVTFDSDGGSKVENQTIGKGNKVSKPANPTKNGYNFVEWQLDGKAFDFDTEITQDITLKAKWEQKKTSTNNENNTQSNNQNNNNPNNNNTNNNPNNNNNGQDETIQENKPKITSTISKINLNENIMVEVYYPSTACGWIYYPTNLEKIYPEYVVSKKLYLDFDEEYSLDSSAYKAKESLIEYDTTKENDVNNKLKTIANMKIPGIANFRYGLEDHQFYYSFDVIHTFDRYTFQTLENSLSENLEMVESVFKDGYTVEGPCGTGPDEPQLLNEELCNQFNLTCDRW